MSHAKSLAIVKNMAEKPKEKAFMAKSIRPKPTGPFTVEHVDQSVIQSEMKRLEDKGYVVLMCHEIELDVIIEGLDKLKSPRAQTFADSLKQLREGAFGK